MFINKSNTFDAYNSSAEALHSDRGDNNDNNGDDDDDDAKDNINNNKSINNILYERNGLVFKLDLAMNR